MRQMLSLIALFFVSVAGAAPVTIDFEEFTPGFSPPDSVPLQSQGYDVDAFAFALGDPPTFTGVVVAGNSGSTSYGIRSEVSHSQDGFSPRATLTVSKSDGGLFALHSLDAYFEDLGFSGVFGETSTGAVVDSASTTIGTGGWLDLQWFTVYADGDGFTSFGSSYVEIDNIVVSAVPIPAAVWLFASAVGLLGMARQRSGR